MIDLPPANLFPYDLVFKHAFLAFFGAVANAINQHRNGKSKGFTDFFFLSVISSFSGVLFALLALYLFDNQYITMAAAGAGGFLGVEGLTIIATKIRDILIAKTPQQ